MTQKKAFIREENLKIPTYELGQDERLPVFYRLRINQGTKGDIYPYKNRDVLTQKLNPDHTYRALILENDYIRVTVLPELGGRIYEGYDKVNDYNFVYKNNVIKPALIGLNGAWISGGIEFNWPQHHRPTTFAPVEYTIEEEKDGSVTAWVGETESKNGQRSLMGISISPDSCCITARVRLYNPTPRKEAFHWWSNLAVHVNDSYRLMFPTDIDYVTFHNKTHVSPFPIVKGEFAGVDYGGEGVDIRLVKNLQPAASFFIFDSAYSFMAGYDDSRDMGTVHVADRFISPGKKFFTWGRADYGSAWQKNLTDTDGDYIEIMTGCFTDNQPDFTWIMPYETKSFEQCWYPLKGIKELKNATKDAAIGVYREDGETKAAFNVTSPKKVVLTAKTLTGVVEETFDALPGQVCTLCLPGITDPDTVSAVLSDLEGRELVSWKKLPMFFADREAPKRRESPARPENIATVDELYLNGLHIEQYKHALISPDIYYLEGLRRDPGDIRCNLAMGVLLYRRGCFDQAKAYLEKARERLVSLNPNPADMECLYQLGLAYRQLGENSKALAAFKRAAWGYAWKSAALAQAAELESAEGDYLQALKDLETSLETNSRSLRAMALRSAIWIRTGRTQEAARAAQATLAWDPLDVSSYFTLLLCAEAGAPSTTGLPGEENAGRTIARILGRKTDAWLKLAEVYLSAGLYEEGRRVLDLCPERTALLAFYQAWTHDRLGNRGLSEEYLKEAGTLPQENVFPYSLFDRTVLDYASAREDCAMAPYYLGCLYYAWGNGEAAVRCFQTAVTRDPGFADAHRSLAQALFEVLHDTEAAREEMEKALACSREPRIFYEYYQLKKVLGASDEELLALLESDREITDRRQDLKIQYIEVLCRMKRYDEVKKLLQDLAFYTYEGGEGLILAIHAFVYIAAGLEALSREDPEGALKSFLKADERPENYHEGPRYQESRAHLHYFMGLGYEACGMSGKAREEYECAAAQRDCGTESQYYKGLALRRLGDYLAAAKLFTALKKQAEETLSDSNLQFFLGFPAALPFEQSERRNIEKAGYSALFYAQLGLGETEEARETERIMEKKGISSLWTEYLGQRI